MALLQNCLRTKRKRCERKSWKEPRFTVFPATFGRSTESPKRWNHGLASCIKTEASGIYSGVWASLVKNRWNGLSNVTKKQSGHGNRRHGFWLKKGVPKWRNLWLFWRIGLCRPSAYRQNVGNQGTHSSHSLERRLEARYCRGHDYVQRAHQTRWLACVALQAGYAKRKTVHDSSGHQAPFQEEASCASLGWPAIASSENGSAIHWGEHALASSLSFPRLRSGTESAGVCLVSSKTKRYGQLLSESHGSSAFKGLSFAPETSTCLVFSPRVSRGFRSF